MRMRGYLRTPSATRSSMLLSSTMWSRSMRASWSCRHYRHCHRAQRLLLLPPRQPARPWQRRTGWRLLRIGANRSQLLNTTNQPFLFPAPTGLAVGFALKEFALRHYPCGDSPQEPRFATQQLVPPLLFNGAEQDSAGCAGGQHNSTSTQKASDSPKFRVRCFSGSV
jgi:hypothetical protein